MAIRSLSRVLWVLFAMQFIATPLPSFAHPLHDTPQQAPVAGPGVEVVALRTAYSRTLRLPDGTYVAHIYTSPIHYRDTQGNFQAIDNSLVHQGDRVVPKGTGLGIAFGADATTVGVDTVSPPSLASMTINGQPVTINFLDLSARTGQLTQQRMRFASAFDTADLDLQATAQGIAWSVTFNEQPTRKALNFIINVGSNSLRKEADGSLTMLPCTTEPCLRFTSPLFSDANGAKAKPSLTSLRDLGKGRYLVSYALPAKWMADPARAMPVRVEAAGTYGAVTATYVSSRNSNTIACGQRMLVIGYDPPEDLSGDGKEIARTFITFDTSLIPAGSIVTEAKLSMHLYYNPPGASGHQTEVHRITSAWDCFTTKWTSQPTYDSSVITSTWVTSRLGRKEWIITDLVKKWLDGEPNMGMAVVGNPETKIGGIYCSHTANGTQCGNNTSQKHPYLEVTYTPNQAPNVTITTPQTGLLPFNTAIPITWVGTDAENHTITYRLMATPDGGSVKDVYFGSETQALAPLDIPCRQIKLQVEATDVYGAKSTSNTVTFKTTIQGDFDVDGKIAPADRIAVENAWMNGTYDTKFDINGDGRIDHTDVYWVIRHLGNICL